MCSTNSCNLEPIHYLIFKSYTVILEPIILFWFSSVEEAEVLNILRLPVFIKLDKEEKF